MARPTILTPEVKEAFFDAILDGVSVREFCKRDGAPEERTIYKALARDPEFVQDYARVKDMMMVRFEADLIEIADDTAQDTHTTTYEGGVERTSPNTEWISRARLRVDTRKWLMSKLAPKKYGDHLKIDQETKHSVDDSVGALMERVGMQGKRIHDK